MAGKGFRSADLSNVTDPTGEPSTPDISDTTSSCQSTGTANWSQLKRGEHSWGLSSEQGTISIYGGECLAGTANNRGGVQLCDAGENDPLSEHSIHDGEWSSPKKHADNFIEKGKREGRRSQEDAEFDDVNEQLPQDCDRSQADAGDAIASQEEWSSAEKHGTPGSSAGRDSASGDRQESDIFNNNQASASKQFSIKEVEPLPGSGLADMSLSVPVIFRPQDRSRNFWQADYAKVRRDLVKCAGCKLPSQKVLKSGFLSVDAPNPEAGRRLLQMTVIAGIAVDAVIPNWYHKNVGKISGVPFRYTDRQLLDCFTEAGVIHVRRQVTFLRKRDGSLLSTPEDGIVLTFRPDIELPETIALGFDVFRVHEYCAAPIQCYRCLRFGHTATLCDLPRRCKLCAGPHIYKECRNPNEPVCANCGGEHAATFTGCPERRKIAMLRRFMPRYNENEEEVSSQCSSSSQRRLDKDYHGFGSGKSEGSSCRDRRDSQGSERESTREGPGRSREDRERSREGRGSFRDRSPRDESRTPSRGDGTPRISDGTDYDSSRDSDDTSDDVDTAAMPPRRNVPPPRQRRRPVNVIKFPRLTRDSRRRFKHGYHRYLHKLVKHGVPVFQAD
ncbi:hypothetical protein HPB49_020397 [Dermacentor silvarum]|uniref:Uncharacterized protein n=1 Tax=Dermacentor silvarum TaxID=543639 RepID=A0ACB8DQQ7_DERSI|nr:hypothetical protein HPB49_020397 [Dermacentor silvarum]